MISSLKGFRFQLKIFRFCLKLYLIIILLMILKDMGLVVGLVYRKVYFLKSYFATSGNSSITSCSFSFLPSNSSNIELPFILAL